jgi:hypothetical protein
MNAQEISRIYETGEQAATEFRNMNEWINWGDTPSWWGPEEFAVAEAGFVGAEKPRLVKGWRWGKIPERGFSFNFADGRREMGISVMEVYGGEQTQDMLSALFISQGRPRVEVQGWLNVIHTGSDGEPLLMWAEEI